MKAPSGKDGAFSYRSLGSILPNFVVHNQYTAFDPKLKKTFDDEVFLQLTLTAFCFLLFAFAFWHGFLLRQDMGLAEYKKKRSFKKTPEPRGGKGTATKLHFVVQKHAASRLHYDFRLEIEGVLKSWAVPKGPSMNPAEKRLAMLVEDHPYDYKNFEGIIPEGNYGAGTVIIWDEGVYEPLDVAKGKAAQEKLLLKSLRSGSLKFRLHGEKLKGEFALVKTPKLSDSAWLLIKHRDEYASEDDVSEMDQSVISGKTLEELASDADADQWKSDKPSDESAKVRRGRKSSPSKNRRRKSTIRRKKV